MPVNWKGAEPTVQIRASPPSIGRYRIERLLGEGAMGRVYLAFDPVIERRVALKILHPNLLRSEEGEALKERFRREARAAGRLVHPNIVTVYDFGETGESAFLAMEYVDGRSLKALLEERERFPLDQVLAWMRQLLSALGYAHRNGVVHRDIKPANLMVLEDGTLKVTDFGIAHLEGAPHLTQVGAVVGSPAYMAPEQCRGEEIDSRADLFAAGVVLYELLTGKRPFRGRDGLTVLHQILHSEPEPLSRLRPDLPPKLEGVVRKALAKRPSERFQTAEAFLKTLEEAVSAERPLRSRRWLLLIVVLVSLAGAIPWILRERSFPVPLVETGILQLQSDPAGAIVLQNGEAFLGVTPFQIELPAGSYRLVFRKFGFRPTEVVVELERGASLPVKITLLKAEPER